MQDIKQQLREIRALVEIEDAQELFFKVLDKQISLAVEQEKDKLEKLEFIIKDIHSFQSDGEIGTLCEQALNLINNK